MPGHGLRAGLLALVLTGLAAAGARAMPQDFAVTDDGVGPTCAFYLGMGNMTWSRRGGDWVDAAETRYGPQPFAQASVAAARGRQPVELDLSELVRGWIEGRWRNAGLLLRPLPGSGGVARFHSRESRDTGARPVLRLEWDDGTREVLAPSADTYLDCSTFTSLGGQPQLLAGGDYSALLAFRPKPREGRRLVRAQLALVSDQQFGNTVLLGAFRADPPWARPPPPVEYGIAADYPGDRALEEHPAVLRVSRFDSRFWFLEWLGIGWLRSHTDIVDEDAARRFEPLSGPALRVMFKRGTNLALDLSYRFADEGQPEPEAVYFRYYLRFADDWNPDADGGKLPGLAGTYGRAGWGMRKTDGYNGWSLRGEFAARPRDLASMVGLTALSSYAYHADIEDAAGEKWPWSEGPGAVLENNRWYCVEQYVRLNTPGKRDGVFRAWVDGRRVIDRQDVRYRNTAELKIERVWLNVYHGGELPAPRDMALYIDNLVIARQYIGPLKR